MPTLCLRFRVSFYGSIGRAYDDESIEEPRRGDLTDLAQTSPGAGPKSHFLEKMNIRTRRAIDELEFDNVLAIPPARLFWCLHLPR
jgi:hypothetical protein